MKALKKLKKRLLLAGKLTKRNRASSQSAIKGETGERLLTNQHDLIQNVDSLGGIASDGLNRFV